jgi:hypothetical protein
MNGKYSGKTAGMHQAIPNKENSERGNQSGSSYSFTEPEDGQHAMQDIEWERYGIEFETYDISGLACSC